MTKREKKTISRIIRRVECDLAIAEENASEYHDDSFAWSCAMEDGRRAAYMDIEIPAYRGWISDRIADQLEDWYGVY